MSYSKRFIDVVVGSIAVLLSAPIVVLGAIAIVIEDGASPFYRGVRIGLNGRSFRMLKLRTMRPGSDRVGVHSTAAKDPRLLWAGRWIRRFKIDELPQFVNVVRGDMSLVGPRPNVEPEVQMYTDVERELLTVRPGVTDYSSIVFADLGEILAGAADPNRTYNRLVRPWKSALGIHYVHTQSFSVDLLLVAATGLNVLSPKLARWSVVKLLLRTGATQELVDVAARRSPLQEHPPPGARADEWESATTYKSDPQ